MTTEQQPYAPPRADVEIPGPARSYGGIGRLAYVGLLGAVSLLNVAFEAWGGASPPIALGGAVVVGVAIFTITVLRLRNIGASGWWSVLLLVPVANLIIGLRCVALPRGYRDTKVLDGPAKLVLGLVWALIALSLAFVVWTLYPFV